MGAAFCIDATVTPVSMGGGQQHARPAASASAHGPGGKKKVADRQQGKNSLKKTQWQRERDRPCVKKGQQARLLLLLVWRLGGGGGDM